MLTLRPVPDDQLTARTDEAAERVAQLRARARYLDLDEARAQLADLVAQKRDTLLDAVDGERRVGHVWLGRDGDELVLYDVLLDEPDRVGELVPALVERARTEGARTIGLGADPAEPTRGAMVAQPGFVARATNMALPLDGEIADPGGLSLQPMTQAEFDAFFESMVESYAHELAQAGMTEEAALARSREQTATLISDGRETPGMVFFTAWVGDEPVGRLWLSTQGTMAFVYDVEVLEGQRRKGYGAAIMNAGALWCRDQGHPVLGLNVFAHNPGARALYDRLGYRVTFDYRSLDVPDA